MGIDAQIFAADKQVDEVSIKDEVANAYVNTLHWVTLSRNSIDNTGTRVPMNINTSAETTAYTTAKASLLTALDTVVAETLAIAKMLEK